ncbi:MAG: diguanylate cyclase [Deferribacteraceae bacterium]|jgi:diguanylate cyclase (GGDEF)-like protein|nr:diguanylate cyclase [Deferribacteraceae bacterium]
MPDDFIFADPSLSKISSLNILYVEDDDVVRTLFYNVLKQQTANVTLASNGKEGLLKFTEIHPDMVITDIRMPEMDGLTMIRHIRDIDRNVPIIISTGYDNDQLLVNSIELNIDRCMQKPVDAKELFSVISKLSQTIFKQRELEAKNQFISIFLDTTPLCMAVFDNTELIYLNKSFKHFLEVSSLDDFKSKYGKFLSLIINRAQKVKDDVSFAKWSVEHAFGTGNECLIQIKLQQNEEPHSFLMTAVCIPYDKYLLTFTDITQLEVEKQYYQHLSEYDSLTRIYNRNRINKELDKEINRALRYRQPLSMLMIDIDHFKLVNDKYGHQIGDIVLIEFASRINNGIRKMDILGRYGGEEFILLMPSTPLANAADIASRICKHIGTYKFTGIWHLTCSIGVAEYMPGESIANFIKRSDDALYQAKNNGRNRFEIGK